MLRLLKYLLLVLVILIAAISIYVYANKVPGRPVSELSEKWAPQPSQFMDIAGMQIHLRDEGPKEDPLPILLIHGTSASLHTWNGWTQALTTQRRVIRFDLPAFGLTGPEPNSNYTIEHYAKVVTSVMDALGVEKAILAGNSLGGYIAWATTVLYPKRVEKLALVDASGYPYDPESVPIGFKVSQNPLMRTLLKDFIPKALVRSSLRNVYGNPDLVTDELVQRYYELATRDGNRKALRERFIQTIPGPLTKRLSEISVPTLIMWGGKDKLIPPKFAQQFKQDIPNSQIVMFDELGHVPHEENPQKTVASFKAFINQ